MNIQKTLPEYHIFCSDSGFNKIYKDWKQNAYIPITIIYKGDTIKDAKMRLRGDTSREYPKKSLKIKCPTSKFPDHTGVINFNAEYTDKSYIRQYMSSLLMRKAGLNCFESEYAVVYLNNQFFGLYLMIENVDDNFLIKRNLDTLSNLYKSVKDGACLSEYDEIKKVWEKKTNLKSDWNDLSLLIENVNKTPINQYYEFVKANFNYEQFISLAAINMLLANGSTWYHNYYLFHDRSTGKWEIFPWDLDKTLSYYNYMPYTYNRTSSNWESDNPLIEKSILNDQIFSDIRSKIDELHHSFVNIRFTAPVIDKLQNLISYAVSRDTTDNIANTEIWLKTLENEKEFFKNQYKNLQYSFENWPNSFEVLPTQKVVVTPPVIKWHPSSISNGKRVSYKLYYSTNFLLETDTNNLKVIDNIVDTFVSIPSDLETNKYFWKVVATNGKIETEGFNTKNFFEYKVPNELPKTINSNLTLEESRSPYLVKSDVVVGKNATLTINAGVEVFFFDTVNIWVAGQIQAKGTKEKPVILKPYVENSYWGCIYIDNEKSINKFDYTIFEEGVLRSKKSELIVIHCIFNMDHKKLYYSQERRESIIWVHHGKFIFSNNTINGNGQGEGMDINYAVSEVENSSFYNTPDAIEYIDVPEGLIKGNLVENSPDDAIDLNGCSNIRITGNMLLNSKDKGISIGTEEYGPSRNITVSNNLITGCNIAIAVKDSSQALILNNTLFNNNTGIACYLKRPGDTIGGEATVVNTIIEKSLKEDISIGSGSKMQLSYCCLRSSTLKGEGNINTAPEFVNTTDLNFYLKTESPCIASGKNGRYIGAFPPESSFIIIKEFSYTSPPSFDEGDWIKIYNPNAKAVDLSRWVIFTGTARYVFPLTTIINSYETILLVSSYKKFNKIYPLFQGKIFMMNFSLSSKGEKIELFDEMGNLIDIVNYSPGEIWPTDNKVGKFSIRLSDINKDNNCGNNWVLVHESFSGK